MQFVKLHRSRPTQRPEKCLKAHRIEKKSGFVTSDRRQRFQLKPAWNFNRKQYFPLMPLERKVIKPHKYHSTNGAMVVCWLALQVLTLSVQLRIAPKYNKQRAREREANNSKSPVPDIFSLVLLIQRFSFLLFLTHEVPEHCCHFPLSNPQCREIRCRHTIRVYC